MQGRDAIIPLQGSATIGSRDRQYPISVCFDVARGRCLIYTNTATPEPAWLQFRLAALDDVFLQNVEVNNGEAEFVADRLGPFFLTSCNQARSTEDQDISNSGLATVLGIKPNSDELNEVELKPRHSRIVFQARQPALDQGSEILFHCNPTIRLNCLIKLDGEEVRVHTFLAGTSLAKYVRCASSTLDLSQYADRLRGALSLFLRRRAFLHFIRARSDINLNLVQPDQAISYGVLVNDSSQYATTLEKLVSSPLLSRKHFLIEAFSNPAALDVRLLNAFVYLEIIDGGRTLSANRVAAVLGIARENADALIGVRISMIHDGLGVREALVQTRQRLRSRKGGTRTAAIIEQALATTSSHGNFYCALMDALSNHLAREIDLREDCVRRRGTLCL